MNHRRALGRYRTIGTLFPLALLLGCTAEVTGAQSDGDGPNGSSGDANGGGGGSSAGAGAGTSKGGAGGTSGTTGAGGGGSSGAPPDCVGAPAADPGAPYSRRLTRTEYNNTVRDLLGDTSAPANDFPAEVLTFNAGTDYFGFDNDPSVQSVPELLADDYFSAADALATRAVANVATLAPCSGTPNRACGETFTRTFGEKAFRRPLAEDEVTRFMTAFDVGMRTDYPSGVRLVVSAMLQSAPFLYRVELGGAADGAWVKPTSWEMASRLSYLLWQSMPDALLFDAARRDELQTPEQVTAQARRMLDDGRARAMVSNFHRQWLGLRGVPNLQKDSALFSDFDESIATDMLGEADRFVEDIVFGSSGDASELFRADTTFVNSNLADFYGVQGVSGSGFQKVSLDPNRRAGLLTLGAPMALLAKHNQTAPVLRGKYVREQLLCEHIDPPPANINVMVPELDPNLTTRERFSQHSVDSACSGCHVMMDPIGFGFENYDAVGRWRDTENGAPIDATGNIELGDGTDVAGPFAGPAALGDRLGSSEAAKVCMVKNWFRYANGRAESDADACELGSLAQRFATSGHNVKDLIVALTQTSAFLHRRPGGQ